ncbi:hypothetical protein NOF04DRAFT_19371 [Fusarium oxysporum II5]|uniref:Uncharacterized protein n=3 Tax=Fusarium oxysporum species complex TaxID=171631 RepID=N1S3T4_FUSC4|nr:uncharacterized protein FOIG_15922 [Fusarium odoratissimum NRRL 54006]EMT72256.1 hypothetical protein FOC4_g10001706 [Fusarium odoratissimum]EXL90818.1 hypothetical protein FOIG_15922 [Fusarium odoratissimum NRRL 54006]KAK2132134.1 hypothetical protein NOF04DRAFT_19371 [Fusarium oxysporum II5]TXC10476.1 hypothetical protein FocTR4_00006070 [Fusarium oxysporum f. sp. cubense]
MSYQERKFFVLRDPLPATETASLLGRLVTSIESPLDRFAPYPDPRRPPHNTNDILPSIVPDPEVSNSSDQTITVARDRGFLVQLSALLNINLSRNREESIRLESDLVKKYVLSSPEIYFEQLMENEDYAKDARDLLSKAKGNRGYLVTGFITASEATWTTENATGRGGGFDASVPVGQACGVPDSGFLDISLGVNSVTNNTQSYTRHVVGEQIFAISYSTVQLSEKRIWPSNNVNHTPVITGPKKAKAHHLAMGNKDGDDLEEVEWDSDDEDGTICKSEPAKLQEEELEIILKDNQQILEENSSFLYLTII